MLKELHNIRLRYNNGCVLHMGDTGIKSAIVFGTGVHDMLSY